MRALNCPDERCFIRRSSKPPPMAPRAHGRSRGSVHDNFAAVERQWDAREGGRTSDASNCCQTEVIA